MKICDHCKIEKDFSEFHKKPSTKDGLQRVCKPCACERSRQQYAANREHHLQVVNKNRKIIKNNRNQFFIEYLLEHPCVDCRESDIRCLEFDHVRGAKFKGLSAMKAEGYSMERIKLEIEKCDVRCANCHRKKTLDDYGSYKNIY